MRRDWRRLLLMSYGISCGVSLAFGIVLLRMIQLHPLTTALVFGIPFGTVRILMDGAGFDQWKARSFLLTVLVRAATYAVGMFAAFMASLVWIVSLRDHRPFWDRRLWATAFYDVFVPFVVPSFLVSFGLVFLFSSMFAVSRKLGPGVAWRWMSGYYHQPRREERAFLFLDMRDSTTLAERLGEMRFSALVRDFMSDLTGPVLATRGEVSHYIGDEAVLTWRADRAFRDDAALRCFRLFGERLTARSDHYRREYGEVPGFKGGLHFGSVVVTEVGEIKSEIVFHGDVLNTAARVQGLCDALGWPLLATEEAASRLSERGEPLGEHRLKGRVAPVSLVGYA